MQKYDEVGNTIIAREIAIRYEFVVIFHPEQNLQLLVLRTRM
jgi:hypothetical protein